MRDNAAIEQEKVNLWTLMERLEKYIYLGKQLDGALDAKAQSAGRERPEQGAMVREEMLFYARQKVTDLLTQMAVNIQGYLALDLLRKNNLELIKGVDRATTTTVAALRTAVMVAQALANQKLVLDQITALNTTTGNLIETTSEDAEDSSRADPRAGGVEHDRDRQAEAARSRTSIRRWMRSRTSRRGRSTPCSRRWMR